MARVAITPAEAEYHCPVDCGRDATRPGEIPLAGWRDIILRTIDELSYDNVSVVAAGVAFFALVAIIPALAALLAVYGLVSEPQEVAALVLRLGGVLPPAALGLVRNALEHLVAESDRTLGVGAVISTLVSLWTASRATAAVLRSIDAAYDQDDTRRGYVRETAMSMAFTAAAIVIAVIVFGLVLALPGALAASGLPVRLGKVLSVLRWPLLYLIAAATFAVLYRHAPTRRRPQWRWVRTGALLASALWLLSSMLLSGYVSWYGHYSETYGSIGAVIILLLWLYVSSYVMLLGAELNAEMEHQTRYDTTVGSERPLGERNAFVADHVGPCRPWPPAVAGPIARVRRWWR